jgi:hypothetical protein
MKVANEYGASTPHLDEAKAAQITKGVWGNSSKAAKSKKASHRAAR